LSDLSAVVVSFNTRDLLRQCLRSLMSETRDLGAEIWVVDNASSDGTCEMLEREFPEVRLIRNRENLGFGRANNQALRRATGSHVLLLNPDAELTPGSLRSLLDSIRARPDVGIVGPKLVFPDGRPQPSVFTFPHPFLDLVVLRIPGIRRLRRFSTSPEGETDADWLLGAALLCRGETLRELGGFDERYFLFGEEKDLQLRMARLGLRRLFTPQAVVIHHKAQSVRKDPVRNFVQLYRSMDLFLALHHSRVTRRLYRGAWILGLLARRLYASLASRGTGDAKRRKYAAALRHLLAGASP
jgi:hypothetical protein